MKKNDILKLIASIIFCELVGAIGTIFTSPAIPIWYAGLNKPFFNPPNWIFGPVWIILFAMMGIALYFVWKKRFKAKKNKIALTFFVIQFIFNVLWSALFFGLRSPLYGLICIILLLATILGTIITFYGVDRKAAYLLIPYILWVSFAAVLNLAIFMLN
jgi:tryptophan-rich sensory protein